MSNSNYEDGYVHVVKNNGHRNFSEGTRWYLFDDYANCTAFSFPVAVDLNTDGKSDLVLAVNGPSNGNGNSVFELFSNGTDFTTPGHISQVSWGGSLAVGDIDGDSALDIAYMHLNSTRDNQPQPAIAFGQVNNNDWTVAEYVYTDKQFDKDSASGGWTLLDIDNNGSLDLVLESSNNSNILGYYLNPGSRSDFAGLSGSPQPITDPDVPFSQWQLVVADFDGDGAMDLADLGHGSYAHLYIYKNQKTSPWIGDANKTDILPVDRRSGGCQY